MRMSVAAVVVREFAHDLGIVVRLVRGFWHSSEKTKQIHQAQSNQHEAHGKLHPESQPGRNNQLEKDNSRAHHKNRQRMPDPPKHTRQGGPRQVPLAADDGCYRDDMIRIGGVPHSQEKTQCDDREQTDHFCGILVCVVPIALMSRAATTEDYHESVLRLNPLMAAAFCRWWKHGRAFSLELSQGLTDDCMRKQS